MTSAPDLGSRTSEEIASQPACWERAVRESGRAADALPRPSERVLVVGCGTSWFVAQAYAALREAAEGGGETDAAAASEVPARLRGYDRVVAVSRSGTSVEVVDALAALPADLPVTALVGAAGTPVAQRATDVVLLDWADEGSVVQTRFATTALALLRCSLGEDLAPVVEQARTSLTAALPAVPERQLVVLGHGWSVGLAHEAALKCREAAAAWAESYPRGEYRHGPIAVADARTLVWSLGDLGPVHRAAVREVGARLEVSAVDPMAELVRLQRFAVAWATARGRDADRPENLTRSVTVA